MRYLIDTDWVIDYLVGIERTVDRVNVLLAQGIGLSSVSLAEIYEGVFYATDPLDNERALHQFIGAVDVLTIDVDICQVFARERGRLRAAGSIIGDFDILIGATAVHHGLTLLTNNHRHFERLEGLKLGVS